MFIDSTWGELPQLVLTNIYSHLSKPDRFSASSTCWHWRNALFQPRFFPRITFIVGRENELRNAFYLESLAHLCNTITLSFNPQNQFGIQRTVHILQKIKSNNCAQRLILRPKYASLLLDQYRSFLKPMQTFLSKRHQLALRELDLGGMECLSLNANELLEAITCADHVQSLGFGSVKTTSHLTPFYLVKPISPAAFERFRNLQKLSVDYDYFSDDWLHSFENLRSLHVLIVHVHAVDDTHPGTSDEAWGRLAVKCPHLRLHLVLIHAYDAVTLLHSHILSLNMPLSHLKVLFCEYLNTAAIDCLSSNYKATLKSVIWVDNEIEFDDFDQDPLVMMAWRCKHLEELVLNGHELDPHNLIGIARLRGPDLKRLEVSDVEWTPQLCDEISDQLGRPWTPLPKTPLNTIFIHDGRYNHQQQNEYLMKCVQDSFEQAGRL